MTTTLAICLVTCISVLACAATAQDVSVDLPQYVATNIPGVAQYLKGASLAFDTAEAAPPGGAYYFLRYRFTIPPEAQNALYSLVLQGGKGPGSRGQSRYSWVVDGGAERPALRLQQVFEHPASRYEHVQPPIRLAGGEHTLELRFRPEHRLHALNRVTEPLVGHHVDLQGLVWRPAPEPTASAPQPVSPTCRLRRGDTIVLFGDSITEEEFYGRHLVRILNRAFPDGNLTVYNSGISLNRSIYGVARLDLDVLALAPDWVVLAFGVNDGMLVKPEEFAQACDTMIRRLQERGTQVVCASPTGMMPYAEALGPDFFCMHATDRASALDHTMAINSALLRQVAEERKAIFADVYAAFTRSAFPRFTLMANQWHPNDAGGRLFAVALLRAWGMSETEIARTGDTRDLAAYRALEGVKPEPDPTPPEPKSPAAPLAGTVVFGAAYGDNRLLAYAPDGRQLAILPTAHHPAALAYSRQRKELYVACEGPGCLQIFSLPELRLEAEVVPGADAYPTGLALSAEEATLWIASYFGSKLIELDLATRRPRREITLPDVVNGVCPAPEGKRLVASLPGKVAVVDPAEGKVIATMETVKFTTPCVDLPGKGLVVIDAERWEAYPIDLDAGRLGAPVPAPAQTRALAVDFATGHLFACDWRNARLLEFEGERCVRATPLPAPALALAVVHIE